MMKKNLLSLRTKNLARLSCEKRAKLVLCSYALAEVNWPRSAAIFSVEKASSGKTASDGCLENPRSRETVWGC